MKFFEFFETQTSIRQIFCDRSPKLSEDSKTICMKKLKTVKSDSPKCNLSSLKYIVIETNASICIYSACRC